MAIFTAIATAIAGAIGLTAGTIAFTVFTSITASVFALGATRLIAKRALNRASAGGDGGGRVQLPPATDNKIPVVYGSAFIGGPVIDAYLTPDQKTMYYVVALAEKTDNGEISFGDIYYDGKLVTFGSGASVSSLTTNNQGTSQVDTRVNGKLSIYLYNDGSASPVNTAIPAYDIMPKWSGNPDYAMTNCAFAIVVVNYNTDAGTTSLGSLMCEIQNTENEFIGVVGEEGTYRPGTAIYDYMTNTRYGCAIPLDKVDDVSLLTDLNDYSDDPITYTPAGGGATQTQPRYRINGPLDTGNDCLDNLQNLVDTCDSWLQYSELTGEWKVVINKEFDGPEANLYSVNSSNLVGGIQISPIDLNETFNELEVAYPNNNIKDQTDYQIILLSDYQEGVMSPNEAVNRLNITFPLVNNAVQAKYLGIRRLLQSREDLVISFNLDFSGIQLEAGDVIRVTHETYGWTDKLFRVSQVVEEKNLEGVLGASIVAFEYNATIYANQALQDYVPAFNTGLLDPNVFDAPSAPIITDGNIANSSTTSFNVQSVVPPNGVITYMDFNYGNSSNTQQHLLYRTLQPGTGQTFTANSNVTINVNDVAAGTLYWSVTARNDFAGRTSPASNAYVWAGPKVSTYNANTGVGGITGNNIQPNSINANNFASNLRPITVVNSLPPTGGTGDVVFLTTNNTLYRWTGSSWTASVANSDITGQLTNSQIQDIAAAKVTGQITTTQIADDAISTPKLAAGAVFANKIAAGTITTAEIAAGTITGNNIAGGTITGNNIQANSIVTNNIAAGAITAGLINVGDLAAINANLGTVISGNIVGGNMYTATSGQRVEITSFGSYPLWYGTGTKDAANAKFFLDTAGNAYFAGVLAANIVSANNIQAGSITSSKFATGIQPVYITSGVPGSYVGDVIYDDVGEKIYRWNGSSYTASVPSTDITGPITATNVANTGIIGNIVASQISNVQAAVVLGQLTNSQIQDIANTKILGQIINDQIASLGATKVTGQLTNDQIASIAAAKLTGQITGTQITDGAISTAKLSAGAVTANEIAAGAVTAGKIAAGAVTATEIAAGSITTAKIAAGAVTAGTIAAGAIEAGKIAAGAVTAGTIAAGAVQAGTLAAGAVTAGTISAGVIGANEIAAGAITVTKIAAGAVEADKLAVNSVTATAIQAGAVTTNKITAGAITTNELATNAVTADKITAGTITGAKIAASTIDASKLSVGSLSAISADMGTLTSGTIQTASFGNRVEISSSGSFPIWAGTGSKTAANASFYVNNSGDAFFAGNLSAAGGTINIDTGAVGAGAAFGLLKGGRFVQCRDGVPVTFTPPFPAGTGDRVIVIFVGGGLTYDSTTLFGPQYQKFEALNITNTGFLPSLRLSEVTGGILTPVTLNFSGASSVTKGGSAEAYDQTYTATFDLLLYPEYNEWFSYGVCDVTLFADTGSGPIAISEPVQYGAGNYVNQTLVGTVVAPAGTVFSLVINVYYGFLGSFYPNTLTYTTTSSTPPNITATPTGVPDVTALVYLL